MVQQSTLVRAKSIEQRSTSQREENGFHAGWTDRLASGKEVVAKPSAAGKVEFEQSARFKQIVQSIREEGLGAQLMTLVDLSEMQQQLLQILANYLSDGNSTSSDIEGIINGALSLLTFALNRQSDLVDKVFVWTRQSDEGGIQSFEDLVITGIYNTRSKSVREEVKSLVKLIATTLQSSQASPLTSLIKILMQNLPGKDNRRDSSQSAEFFSLLCGLIEQYR